LDQKMTALTDRIAEVLREHVSAQTANWETKLRCECGQGDFTTKLEYAAHVAEQIEAALRLTEEKHAGWSVQADGKWTVELCRPSAPPGYAARYPEHTNWQWVAFGPDGIGCGGFKTREEAELFISQQEPR